MKEIKKTLCTIIIFVSLFISLAMVVRDASAYLIAYEGFDYTQGSSITLGNGGYGWSTPWQNFHPFYGDFEVAAGLSYPGLPVLGGSASALMMFPDPNYGVLPSGADIRGLVEKQETGVVWISFLGDLKFNQNGCDNLRFNDQSQIGNPTLPLQGTITGSLGTNDGSNYWFFSDGSVSPYSSNTVFTSVPYNSGIHLALLRIDYNAATTTIWMDPVIGAFTGIGGITANFAPVFDSISLVARYGGTFDEIRIGTTVQDVFVFPSVPEPTTLLLIGFGLAGLVGVRRRMHK